MKRIKFTEEQIKEIVRLYTEEKMGTLSIGKIFGVHKAVINRTLKENSVVIDTPGRRNIGGKAVAQKKYESKPEIKEKRKEYHSEWSKENKKELKKYHTKWREENREHVNKYSREYERMRCATDPKYKLGRNTRTALSTCLKEANVAKYRSTFDILGYTLEELMEHLESLFTDGMTWDNYGEWHIDHIKPISSFKNDTKPSIVNSLNNLQPLWATTREINGVVYIGNLNKNRYL